MRKSSVVKVIVPDMICSLIENAPSRNLTASILENGPTLVARAPRSNSTFFPETAWRPRCAQSWSFVRASDTASSMRNRTRSFSKTAAI